MMQEHNSTPGAAATRLRGVNLGGWLVLEKWMTPSLFEGLAATDETTWCAELGRDAAGAPARALGQLHHARRLRVARRRAASTPCASRSGTGSSARRIRTTRSTARTRTRSSRAASRCSTARSTGRRSSGCASCSTCTPRPAARTASTTAASRTSASGTRARSTSRTRSRCSDGSPRAIARRARLHAIEVLNEPRWDVPTPLLKDYYRRAYDAIRTHCPPDARRGRVPRRLPLAPRVPALLPRHAASRTCCSTCTATSASTAPTSTWTSTATCTRPA